MAKKLKILQLCFALICLLHGKYAASKKLVCVVGAGMSGINSIKHLADYPDEFQPIGFEIKSNVGGLWIYTDQITVDPISPMYKSLRSQVAKEVMTCPDYPEFYGENRSAPSHPYVVEYIRNYTDHFNLRQYIQFNTRVEKITPISKQEPLTKWLLEVRKLNSNTTEKIICDATIICTGHYTTPKIPIIPGLESFSGRVLHSSSYRKPEDFVNQTVVILGAGVSGVDIAIDLSTHAKTIYLSHRHEHLPLEPPNVIQVPGVVAVNNSDLILQDGSTIKFVNSLIICTGYKTTIPRFLDETTGVRMHGEYVYPLYKGIINVEYPTMGFVGFNTTLQAFCPRYYTQANYFIYSLRGKFELPNHEGMMKIVDNAVSRKFVEDHDITKLNELAVEGNFKPVPDFYAKAYAIWAKHKTANPYHYKEYNLVIFDDGNITIVEMSSDSKSNSVSSVDGNLYAKSYFILILLLHVLFSNQVCQ